MAQQNAIHVLFSSCHYLLLNSLRFLLRRNWSLFFIFVSFLPFSSYFFGVSLEFLMSRNWSLLLPETSPLCCLHERSDIDNLDGFFSFSASQLKKGTAFCTREMINSRKGFPGGNTVKVHTGQNDQ